METVKWRLADWLAVFIRKPIDCFITDRLVTFYRHLVETGAIKELPKDGPPVA